MTRKDHQLIEKSSWSARLTRLKMPNNHNALNLRESLRNFLYTNWAVSVMSRYPSISHHGISINVGLLPFEAPNCHLTDGISRSSLRTPWQEVLIENLRRTQRNANQSDRYSTATRVLSLIALCVCNPGRCPASAHLPLESGHSNNNEPLPWTWMCQLASAGWEWCLRQIQHLAAFW